MKKQFFILMTPDQCCTIATFFCGLNNEEPMLGMKNFTLPLNCHKGKELIEAA